MRLPLVVVMASVADANGTNNTAGQSGSSGSVWHVSTRGVKEGNHRAIAFTGATRYCRRATYIREVVQQPGPATAHDEAASSRRAIALLYGPAAIPVINRRKYALMPGAILLGILLGFCASSWALIGPTAKLTWILCIRHTALAGLPWSRESQLPQRLTMAVMKLRQSGIPRRPNAAMSQSPSCLSRSLFGTSSFRFVFRMFPSQEMIP
ncbi:hypothetical protein CI102_2345 [Trichoderma harzianum]|nr:hypothetical protein CI102_2345 [Trichoderma harzianum]